MSELDAIDDELLAAIARVKGHAAQKAEPQPVSEIYPLSASVAAKEQRQKMILAKAQETALKTAVPGQEMPDGTIYLGKYTPIDREGNSLRQEFNILAAKEDIPDGPRTYMDTVKYISELKTWHGYAGVGYINDANLYKALRQGSYKGQWIIPTKEILNGGDTERTMQDNLFTHKSTGAFRNTFNTSGDGRPGVWPSCYWSCTEDSQDILQDILSVNFSRNNTCWNSRDYLQSCRPVRLVPCT